jgi:hypothetical protein
MSGTPYKLVWWVNDAQPDLLPSIFTATLHLGIHPWTEAKVVVIPKPGKTDYTAAKSYRPISLLECTGKVLEKIVTARLGSDVDHHDLLGPSQFGSCHFHSATDVATTLRYKAEETIKAGRIRAILLLDISRFFDSLNSSTMFHILSHLGIDNETCSWVRSLMDDRTVRLQVNDFTSEAFHPVTGTPQGSPASPIISALFTSPLLCESQGWEGADLSLYIDDRAIFASGPTFHSATTLVAQAGSAMFSWLHRFGLSANNEKTEVMFFRPAHTLKNPHLYGHPPSVVTLTDGPHTVCVTPANSLRYLGVFFTPRLSWTLHVKTMASWVRSTVKVLGVLGNSVRGFSLVQWRKVFQAILVPVLTYGAQVWFTDKRQLGLIKC